MSINVQIDGRSKQLVAVAATDFDGIPDTTTQLQIIHSPNPPTAYSIQQGADNRHFWIVGINNTQQAQTGVVTFAHPTTGKSDTANVSTAPKPDLSSLTASLDGTPVPQ